MFETTHEGYGGETKLNADAANRSLLAGIGQTTIPGTNIGGRTAIEAYNNYAKTGASEAQLAEVARRIRAQY